MEDQPSEAPPAAPETEPTKKKKWLPIVVILVAVIVIGSVGGWMLLSQSVPAVLDRIDLTPDSVSLDAADPGQQFTARALDASGGEISGATIDWTVSPSDVVLMSGQHGRTIAVDPFAGSAITVTASSTYNGVTKSDSSTITVNPYADSLTLTAPASVVSHTAFNVTVRAFDQNGAAFSGYDGVVGLSSSDTSAATFLPAAYTFSGTESSHEFAGLRLGTPGQAATITATDSANATLTAQASVSVQNQAPHAEFRFDSVVGDEITVNATSSFDVDGSVAAWSWNWGDSTSAGSGETAQHTYAQWGTYTVALTVTDNLGATGSRSHSQAVNAPPEAQFTYWVQGLSVTANGTASTDPDGAVTDYRWDWGDGSAPATGVNRTHAYATFGLKTVNLTVTDDGGLTGWLEQGVLAKSPPTAQFVIRAGAGAFDLIVNASTSVDPDGTVVSYTVDWGDDTSSPSTLIDFEVSHTYASGGTFTLNITVVDNDGLTDMGSTSRCVGLSCPGVPHAVFTWEPVPVVASEPETFNGTDSYDESTLRTIVSWSWEFGDGEVAIGASAVVTHAYDAYGVYLVNLTVQNDLGDVATTQHSITVLARPSAGFTYTAASVEPWVVNADGSGSSDLDGTIASYAWDWGDTSAWGSGLTATHTYATAGDYWITLYVTDNDGLVGTAAQKVSVGNAYLDYSYWDFFNVPFGEWWDMRTKIYYDRPLSANCFNATAILDGYCQVLHAGLPDASAYPYANWYPSAAGAPPESDPLIYAPYRFSVDARNITGYDLGQPVFYPNCDALAWTTVAASLSRWPCAPSLPQAGGHANFSVDMQYLDISREIELIDQGCPDLTSSNDGFLIEATFRLDLDYTAAQRLFGVQGNPATWWGAHTKAGCGSGSSHDTLKSGDLEMAYNAWMSQLGNYAFDIFNEYQYPYTTQFIDISWSITGAGSANLTHVVIHTGGWGAEALLARLFYYGRTNYTDALTTGAQPTGWWGMELPWFEDFHMSGNLTQRSMNFTLSSVMQYHFQELAETGNDGLWNTIDDQPVWQWSPILADYIPSQGTHRYSELDAYAGLTYLHTTPGSPRYGQQYDYDYVPAVWRLTARQTQTFIMPTGVVAFHDPYNSTKVSSPWGIIQHNVTMTYSYSVPATGAWSWSEATHVLSVTGPTVFADPSKIGTPPSYSESRPIYVFRRTSP